jgi:hypothetical protein
MNVRTTLLAVLAPTALALGACRGATGPTDVEALPADTVFVTDTLVVRDTVIVVRVDTIVVEPDTVVVFDTELVIDTIVIGPDTVVMVDTVYIADTVLVGTDTVFVTDTLILTPRVLWVTEHCSDNDPDDYVTFADVRLAEAVAEAAGKPPGNVTCAEAARLKKFTYAQTYLDDLRGLQNLVGLEVLVLRPTIWDSSDLGPLAPLTKLRALRISGYGPPGSSMDLTPLVGMADLESLSLDVERRVQSLAPLAGLTELERLYLRRLAHPSDLAPLAGLTRLTGLTITETHVEDLSPLAALTALRLLVMHETFVDIELDPLAGLTAIDTLALSFNPGVRNIQPLLDNPGLGSGDLANFVSTSVSCADIGTLEARGVTVMHDCLRIATVSLPTGQVGAPYEATLTFEPTSWGGSAPVWSVAVGSLPPGLGLSEGARPGDAVITGTPIQAGSWTFTVDVRDPPTGTQYRRDAQQELTIVSGEPDDQEGGPGS